MNPERFGDHVTLETRGDGVAVMRLDDPEGGFFTFSESSVASLEAAISALEDRDAVHGLVAIGSDRGFIAGADVRMIYAVEDAATATALSERGQALFARFARLPYPTVAAIHGPCLGGGLEFALALDWRIASRARATKIGLPEVRLGIVPGFGGTQRLPRLVGLPTALDLMLKGSQLDGVRALKRGVVDRVVPEHWLLDRALELVERGKPRRRLHGVTRFLTCSRIGRSIVARKVAKTLGEGPARFFPAPGEVLRVAVSGLRSSSGDYEAEAAALGGLAVGPVCKNLIRLFLESENARKAWRRLDPNATAIESAHVVGAGVMGAGIAGQLAKKGVRTRLIDLSKDALGQAVKRLERLVGKALKRRRIKQHEYQAALDRLAPSTRLEGFESADVVIEAVAEKLEVKRKIFAAAEPRLSEGAILATNTSSLPLAEIGAELEHPERLVGLHFFNPPEKMPLVEVIRHDGASDAALARAARLAADLGKFPVLVEDGPGFLVNRCLGPYLGAAVRLLEEGCDPERIDRIATDFGMPMGPLRLLDEIGWDIASSVCRILAEAYPDRMSAPAFIDAMRDAGRLGKKSGSGIYEYDHKGKARPSGPALALVKTGTAPDCDDETILDRLMQPLVTEAQRCLDEAVVGSEGELDLAMAMGIGFPPHVGGPLRWARGRGHRTTNCKRNKTTEGAPS